MKPFNLERALAGYPVVTKMEKRLYVLYIYQKLKKEIINLR